MLRTISDCDAYEFRYFKNGDGKVFYEKSSAIAAFGSRFVQEWLVVINGKRHTKATLVVVLGRAQNLNGDTVRVDNLVNTGNDFEIYEVKSCQQHQAQIYYGKQALIEEHGDDTVRCWSVVDTECDVAQHFLKIFLAN